MSTTLAIVLSTIALKFSVNDQVPKLPYMTLFDYFLMTCLYIQVVVGLSNALIFQLWRRFDDGDVAILANWRIRITTSMLPLSGFHASNKQISQAGDA